MILRLLFIFLLQFAHAETLAPQSSCAEILSGRETLMSLAYQVREPLQLRWQRFAGHPVSEMIAEAQEQRKTFSQKLKVWGLTQKPELSELVHTTAYKLKMKNPKVTYGDEIIPTFAKGKIPALWRQRYKELEGLSLKKDQIGTLGEWIAVRRLPGILNISLHPRMAFGRKHRKHIDLLVANDASLYFMREDVPGELDLVFDGGNSFAEIKYAFKPMLDESEAFVKFKRQAERLARMIRLSEEIGSPRNGYFVFVGAGPSPTQTALIDLLGLKTILIPLT